MRLRSALLTTSLIIGTATAQAHQHHSIVGVYDFGERMTLSAVVVAFEFVNPHPFITVDMGPAEAGRYEVTRLTSIPGSSRAEPFGR